MALKIRIKYKDTVSDTGASLAAVRKQRRPWTVNNHEGGGRECKFCGLSHGFYFQQQAGAGSCVRKGLHLLRDKKSFCKPMQEWQYMNMGSTQTGAPANTVDEGEPDAVEALPMDVYAAGTEGASRLHDSDGQLVALKLEATGSAIRFQPDKGAQCNVRPVKPTKTHRRPFSAEPSDKENTSDRIWWIQSVSHWTDRSDSFQQ